ACWLNCFMACWASGICSSTGNKANTSVLIAGACQKRHWCAAMATTTSSQATASTRASQDWRAGRRGARAGSTRPRAVISVKPATLGRPERRCQRVDKSDGRFVTGCIFPANQPHLCIALQADTLDKPRQSPFARRQAKLPARGALQGATDQKLTSQRLHIAHQQRQQQVIDQTQARLLPRVD